MVIGGCSFSCYFISRQERIMKKKQFYNAEKKYRVRQKSNANFVRLIAVSGE